CARHQPSVEQNPAPSETDYQRFHPREGVVNCSSRTPLAGRLGLGPVRRLRGGLVLAFVVALDTALAQRTLQQLGEIDDVRWCERLFFGLGLDHMLGLAGLDLLV